MKLLFMLIRLYPGIVSGYIRKYSISGNYSKLPEYYYSESQLCESFLDWSHQFRFFHIRRKKLDSASWFWYVISALETRRYYSALQRVRLNSAISSASFVNSVRKAG